MWTYDIKMPTMYTSSLINPTIRRYHLVTIKERQAHTQQIIRWIKHFTCHLGLVLDWLTPKEPKVIRRKDYTVEHTQWKTSSNNKGADQGVKESHTYSNTSTLRRLAKTWLMVNQASGQMEERDSFRKAIIALSWAGHGVLIRDAPVHRPQIWISR